MTLKAIIPKGQTELTVNGLHQWDYGRKLEIHSDELPAVVEVHFACAGMKDAVVRVCEAVDGVATAVIPDRCLEQTTPITAWVYVIDDTAGFTAKTITLPIIPRTKPQPSGTVPEEYTDKYTEAITAMNDVGKNLNALVDEAVSTVNTAASQAVNTASSVANQAVSTVNTAATQAVSDVITTAEEVAEAFREGAVVVKEALTAEVVGATSKNVTLTWSGEAASGTVELEANSAYLFTAANDAGVYATLVLYVLANKQTSASSSYKNRHTELFYNHETKKLFLRRYYYVADDTNEVGYDSVDGGTQIVTYAKIVNITPEV